MKTEVHVNTRESTLSMLLKDGELSASALASSMAISVQAMRRHLRSLEEEGLVESVSISMGPGRPSNLWHLTNKGLNRFNTGKGTEDFALGLLRSIEKKLSKQTLDDVLSQQALEKAIIYRRIIGSGEIKDRLLKLVKLRKKEGHMTDIHPSIDGSASWYLNAFHCSIRTIAEHFPIVCDQELQLIRLIFPDCQVERAQWRIETGRSCGFKITPN